MRALKKSSIRLIALLLFQSLCLGTAQSQSPGSPRFNEEFSKQESIYHGRGETLLEGYVIDRPLSAYARALPSGFGGSLANLGPDDRWLDIGAGTGQAILDYYSPLYDSMQPDGGERRGRKARAVAMSIEDRRTPYWYEVAARFEASQIRYVVNKRLREYSLEELGQFQLITDVIGGFSYTANLSLFMENVLGFLKVNGVFYTVLQDVRSEQGTNKPYYEGSPFLTEIKNAGGSDVGVCSWLKSITCVQVTCESKPNWKPPVEGYRIHKVCDNAVVPALKADHFEAGTPPERGFSLASPPPPTSPSPIGASR